MHGCVSSISSCRLYRAVGQSRSAAAIDAAADRGGAYSGTYSSWSSPS
ncbi:hypothetical protein KKY_99 [Pelagibacterium halotolerans B2]|uniref:Uncharacterized protein n=1 Tax=Pelagibacterium halotolerans (strain DSM 22347 / JCM 15775 / CGMCC 1.7692 / B2) TaxID=1082931 RepID=G4RGH0_PELHB|nr:hypothetical protein KKY_99 [Pelagibacterium halotolerans B2]